MLFFEAVIFQARPPVGYGWLILFTNTETIISVILVPNLSQIIMKNTRKDHPYRARQIRFYRSVFWGFFLIPCCIVYKLVLDSGITV